MDHITAYPPNAAVPTTFSSTSSVNASSPTTSLFSKGHSSKGSNSSAASSPVPRDSLDMFGGAKRLEDVTEEPHERDDLDGYTLVNDRTCDWSDYDKALSDDYDIPLPVALPRQPQWSPIEPEDWAVGPGLRQPKRRRSVEQTITSHSHRFGNKFGSLSRRWRNRSAAGPQLSIVTHHSTPVSRSESMSPSQLLSPALSAISRCEGGQPMSPVMPVTSDVLFQSQVHPIDIAQGAEEEEVDMGQATTPLLPPLLSEHEKAEEPVHSPLQSPAIAPRTTFPSSRTSLDAPLPCLPSPPLSTKPSVISLRNRSRSNTLTNSPYYEIPPMQLLDDPSDPLAIRLGHANFSIHPEPYIPETLDLDTYVQYRNNWDQARTNYAKHIARTAEHYGPTSKVYYLTEEKWASIDQTWSRQHDLMRKALAPTLARLSDGDTDMQDSTTSSAVLEKPMLKVIVPVIDDKSGKFPELGDGEIVGPMSVAPPRALTGDSDKGSGTKSPPLSPHKRNLLKLISDIFHT